MIYNTFHDLRISALGMGTMRLPVINGKEGMVDEKAAEEILDYCYKKGVNYFDTAWGYHDETSELVVGRILEKYPRESFYLANKFPGYDLANMPKVKEIFTKQLEKCRVEYFDFYMYHNLCEINVEEYLDPKYGIHAYLLAQKAAGRIRHLGFSAHGNLNTMKRFLEAVGTDMEFCQIELNYFDWSFQHAKQKVELLNEWNIPILVMEPVRGGQLATLDESAAGRLKALRPEEKIPAWAFRFLQGIPNLVTTLSGMSAMQQAIDNIATYEESRPLSDSELCVLLEIADEMIARTAVPCTACHYCTSHCPKELDIPELMQLYNEVKASGSGVFIGPMGLAAMGQDKQPSACIGCRSCEQVCPQQIKISEVLAAFAASMEQAG